MIQDTLWEIPLASYKKTGGKKRNVTPVGNRWKTRETSTTSNGRGGEILLPSHMPANEIEKKQLKSCGAD